MKNNGIISVGNNNANYLEVTNNAYAGKDVDWDKLEKELADLRESCAFHSIKDFADRADGCVKKRDFGGVVNCLKKLGAVGVELLTKTSAALLVEISKKYLNI
jgi:biopolymer transport protein ExbD